MKIALVHYHLKSGGVTSVVLNQARSLADSGMEILIIAGEAPSAESAMGNCKIPFALVKELAYDRPGLVPDKTEIESNAVLLANEITRAMKEQWGTEADIIHIHNPLIQKNSLLIPAIKILNSRGLRLFLQNHDLAEDFRPDVYTGLIEYPENCHYGVINSRDYNFLCAAGLTHPGIHLIPNEVFSLKAGSGLKKMRYLYPVRAIRRKNIGEALLLSLFIPEQCTVAITLPSSQRDNAIYRRWRAFAAELDLPVEFDLGLRYGLAELLGSSVCALSTSVKEGFGFAFLEPWTAHLNLFGRRIDYVCTDFEQSGVCFNHLYSSLDIPLDYVSGTLLGKIENAIRGVYTSFGYAHPHFVPEELVNDIINGDTVDFGRLDEQMQESIICRVHGSMQERRSLQRMNPLLEYLSDRKDNSGLIEANCRVIAAQYGKERITTLLCDIYRKIMETPVIQKISKPTLLDLFLNPRRLFLVGISDG